MVRITQLRSRDTLAAATRAALRMTPDARPGVARLLSEVLAANLSCDMTRGVA